MIDSQSRLGCGLPTEEGIRLVGRLQDALWRVELQEREEGGTYLMFNTLSDIRQWGLAERQ
ncbi:hypothetical protein PRIPAC_94383 [Pristionchus pacificus]|uniref:Uncharacterized protein n=1 Tax=Pristionchus pacificus TaxID=54126 RepID=A0A2A6CI81_PRIPA|nr:hypothetical protein PRIPAC_94383 [Pristionchus pacificus]|eukprot:PDM77934.1 hypothetical protein PRIPAC_34801 [Pristionchus pacificus]